MTLNRIATYFVVLCLASAAVAAEPRVGPNLIPKPTEFQPGEGVWKISAGMTIGVELPTDETRAIALRLANQLPQSILIDIAGGASEQAKRCDVFLKLSPISGNHGDEGYKLEIHPTGVYLEASEPQGLYRGVQTLEQVIQDARAIGDAVTAMQIIDRPRFRHRGLMLDSARHFVPKETIKRTIDLVAYHKLNVLHWHLTDDQGWRIEIQKYPKLTETGAWRRATRPTETPVDGQGRYGGFYTQEDIREIVAYARERYVTIIPEIEMPGHSMAALASYPELACEPGAYEVSTRWDVHEDVLCAGDDRVFAFVEGVLLEVMRLFESPYIHIGGDECPKTRWKSCVKCQARMRALELKNEDELQSYFIRRVGVFLAMRGRRLVGWDEILEGGLPPSAIVQAWRGMDRVAAAARNGNQVIVSPRSHGYLDYRQGDHPGESTEGEFLPLSQVYSLEPVPPGLSQADARRIIGVEAALWTERVPPELLDWQMFPRLCAIAEVGWSEPQKNWEDFSRRLTIQMSRLDALGVRYYVAPPHLATPNLTFADVTEVAFHSDTEGVIRYTLDDSGVSPDSPRYERPIPLSQSRVVRAKRFLANGRSSDELVFSFRRLTPKAPVAVSDVRPGLRCEVFEGAFSRATWFDGVAPIAFRESTAPDLSQRPGDERFGLRYRGYFDAPRDGVYRFFLEADDAARIVIGDEIVVTAAWNMPEQEGVVWLRTGRHPFRIEFWQTEGPFRCELAVQPPGQPREPLSLEQLGH